MAVFGSKPFEHSAIGCFAGLPQSEPFFRLIIAGDQIGDGTGYHLILADFPSWEGRLAAHCLFVSRHKPWRPRQPRQWHFRISSSAKIAAQFPVPIVVGVNVRW